MKALNNTVSLVFSYLLDLYDEAAVNFAYTVTIYVLLLLGGVSFLVLLRRRRPKPVQPYSNVGFWRKTFWFFFNPTMLVALGLIVYFTAQFVG